MGSGVCPGVLCWNNKPLEIALLTTFLYYPSLPYPHNDTRTAYTSSTSFAWSTWSAWSAATIDITEGGCWWDVGGQTFYWFCCVRAEWIWEVWIELNWGFVDCHIVSSSLVWRVIERTCSLTWVDIVLELMRRRRQEVELVLCVSRLGRMMVVRTRAIGTWVGMKDCELNWSLGSVCRTDIV